MVSEGGSWYVGYRRTVGWQADQSTEAVGQIRPRQGDYSSYGGARPQCSCIPQLRGRSLEVQWLARGPGYHSSYGWQIQVLEGVGNPTVR
jgi:hypothetical protein